MRLTTAEFGKNKVAAYLDRIRKFRGHENSAPAGYAIADEATDIRSPKQYYTTEAKWTNTLSSKLLFEAGIAINNESYSSSRMPESSADPAPRHHPADGVRRLRRRLYYREPIRRTFVHRRPMSLDRTRSRRACSTAGATSGGSGVRSPT